MNVGPGIQLALRRLRRRPLRTILLLQGTVWGVAIALLPAAVLAGTRAAGVEQSADLGTDRVAFALDPTAASPAGPLEAADLKTLPGVAEGTLRYVGGVRRLTTQEGVEAGLGWTVLGSAGEPLEARGLEMARGRFLQASDPTTACVVEADVHLALGLPPIEIGATLDVPTWPEQLTVVGVAASRSERALRTSELGFDTEHRLYKTFAQGFLMSMGVPTYEEPWKRSERCIYVPLATTSSDALDWIFARAATGGDPEQIATAFRSSPTLAERPIVARRSLVIPTMMDASLDRFQAVTYAMFLACLAMGAVVMANLGLVAAMARQREIAIQRVEGATQGDIFRQFLMEGLLLAALGAAIGLPLGMGLAELRVQVEPVSGFDWRFPWVEAGIAVGVALFAGLCASVLPALRAARQDPVLGLADE